MLGGRGWFDIRAVQLDCFWFLFLTSGLARNFNISRGKLSTVCVFNERYQGTSQRGAPDQGGQSCGVPLPGIHRAPAKEGLCDSWCVAWEALAPVQKKLQGEELFLLKKQVWPPGSQDPSPGRTCHPILLGFTIGTSSSVQKAAHGGSEAFLPAGSLTSSEVRVSLEITFYFCPRSESFVLHIWANFPQNPRQPTEVAHRLLIFSFWQKAMVHFKRRDRKISWPIFFLGVGRLSCKGENLYS